MIDYRQDFSRFFQLEEAIGSKPGKWQKRILAELRFVSLLSKENGDRYESQLQRAEAILSKSLETEGVVTNTAAEQAEQELLPCAEEAKSYEFLCVAHAHIDMNWMWGFHETVGSTVDTFRTMLQIMKEYPDFRFSQSQASVYRILERFAPSMLEEVKERVKEGRWEVTASTWVENDKNMPSEESLSRQYLLAKRYLCDLFQLSPDDLCIDFEPDTFGHNINMPEIASNAGIKYYYHCRGTVPNGILNRWRAPSGAELMVFTEPDWYNTGMGTHTAEQAIELAKIIGLRSILKVYGVGDHGGGPTRRDLDCIIEMNSWPVYPRFRFSTLREYFNLAEQLRSSLPVMEKEMNLIFDGCYTTQTRIKTGNRRSERALRAAELFSAQAALRADMAYPAGIFDEAWEKVLFNQFHDIIPGSGVTETREYASALYQEVGAAAQTQSKLAFHALTEKIDTSSLIPEQDISFSRGEGGGAGYDLCGRSAGKVRIYHVFQSAPQKREQVTEFVVWDYEGKEDLLAVKSLDGTWINSQIIDRGDYWGHHFVRLIAPVSVPASGWATYLVAEKPVEGPWTFVNDLRAQFPDTFILENNKLRAEFSPLDGALISLKDKRSGREMLPAGSRAQFTLAMEGVRKNALNGGGGMSSWATGRHKSMEPLQNIEIALLPGGPVRSRMELQASFGKASSIQAEIYLDQDSDALQFNVTCDWREFGGSEEGVPCLLFTLPEECSGNTYTYDVPAGFIKREGLELDLPATNFVMAGEEGAAALILASKEKYGYRCGNGRMALTLIRAAYEPDPTPEIGMHKFSFAVLCREGKKELAEYSRRVRDYIEPPVAVSGYPHGGNLPSENSFIELSGGTVLLSSVKGGEDGTAGVLFVRLFETAGKATEAVLTCSFDVAGASFADTLEQPAEGKIRVSGREIHVPLKACQLVNVRIKAAN